MRVLDDAGTAQVRQLVGRSDEPESSADQVLAPACGLELPAELRCHTHRCSLSIKSRLEPDSRFVGSGPGGFPLRGSQQLHRLAMAFRDGHRLSDFIRPQPPPKPPPENVLWM